MRFSARALFVFVLAGMSLELAQAQLTYTVEPDTVFGGTGAVLTGTAVLTAPHNGAVITFDGAGVIPGAHPLAPGQTTVQGQVLPSPPLVSVPTTLTYRAIALYNGPTLVASDTVTVNPLELRLDLTQTQILAGARQVIGTVSLSPAAVGEVFVSFTTNPGDVLFLRDVTIPPGGTAPVEVVAAAVTETTNVQLTAAVFTFTGFLTTTGTVAVLAPALWRYSAPLS